MCDMNGKLRKTLQYVRIVNALASGCVDLLVLCLAFVLQNLLTVAAADFRVPFFVMVIAVLWSHAALTLASARIPELSG